MFSRPVILIILLGVSLLMACEKTLPLKLSASSTDLVVEGTIEKGQQPYVYLTNSLGFFNKIDLSSLSYVHHAVIQVQDVNTGSNITLKEYSIDTLVGGQHYSFTLYAPDMADTSAMNFKGQLDHTYKLQISSNGKQYVSYTRIPNGNGLDSIWTEKVKNNDSLRTLRAIYVDPDTFGNAIRVQTLVHKVHKTGDPEVYQTAFNQVYNDDIVNGARLPISIDIGYDKGKTYSADESRKLGFLEAGDTVTIKWCPIDKAVYRFWETLTFSQNGLGNPFAAPTRIQSNVPGALGVWAGYNSMYFTIVDTLK